VVQSIEALRYKPGSIPYVVTVIGIFDVILPAATMALGSTQSLTEMSTRNISREVKAVRA
jgi:hypothetical protein